MRAQPTLRPAQRAIAPSSSVTASSRDISLVWCSNEFSLEGTAAARGRQTLFFQPLSDDYIVSIRNRVVGVLPKAVLTRVSEFSP